MRGLLLVAITATLSACQPPQAAIPPDAPDQWRILETKGGVTVSLLPSSVRSGEKSTVAWVKAQHDTTQETELRGQTVTYDRELNYWSVDCETLKFSVDKREFYMGEAKVDEWPSGEMEALYVEKELPTPGRKAYRVVVGICKAAGKA